MNLQTWSHRQAHSHILGSLINVNICLLSFLSFLGLARVIFESSGYVSGIVALPLDIIIGQAAAIFQIVQISFEWDKIIS